jgi:hypothetical protein
MLNIIKNTINRVFASGVDSDASAFITATGLSGTTQKSAITTLVKDLKSSGLWGKMKAVYPMVTDNRNTLSYTEDFTNAAWTQTNVSVSANSTTAPNSTLTADTLAEVASSTTHILKTTDIISFTTGITYTYSIYAKNTVGGRGLIQLAAYQIATGNTDAYCNFNLANGTIGANANCTYSIQDVGNGWYRCTITATSTKTYLDRYNVILIDNINASSFPSYLGDASKSIYIWGAQFEIGALSTYQPILTTPSAYMASQMKYNLKDARDLDAAFRLTWSGGWTYSATGATPNGTNGWANTNLNPVGLINGTNSHMSYYSRTDSDGLYADLGHGGAMELLTRLGNVYYADYPDSTRALTANTSSLGNFIISNTSAGGKKVFKNASTLISSAFVNVNFSGVYTVVISNYNNLVPARYSNRQFSFVTIGDGLTDQDSFLLNQIVEKYQVALSRGVQAAQSFYYNSAYSNEANTYLYSTQITGTTQVSAINTLINGLKANNLWTKMKAVYPFVTDYRNILAYTEDFANAYWLKYRVNVSGNTTTAPNGTLTADSLSDTAVNDAHQLYLSLLATAPNTYTFSFYVKANNSTKNLAIYPFTLSAAGGTGSGGVILTQTGTFVANIGSGVSSYSSTNVGDGWYRISVTGYTTNTNEVRPVIGFANGTNETYLGDGSGIYIWGAQFEIGASASTYQPVLAANNYATNVAAQMKFNLVNPQDTDAAFRLAFSGGWTYSTNGAQPNGTNGYADTKLVVNTNLTQDNTHLSFYSRTNISQTATDIGYGGTSANRLSMELSYLGSFASDQYNYNTGRVGVANPNSLGFYIGSRTNSTTHKAYKNNTQFGSTNTGVSGSIAAYNGSIYISSSNSTPFLYSSKQVAFSSIGDGLSDAEAALLYSIVQQFQTTLNRSVV